MNDQNETTMTMSTASPLQPHIVITEDDDLDLDRLLLGGNSGHDTGAALPTPLLAEEEEKDDDEDEARKEKEEEGARPREHLATCLPTAPPKSILKKPPPPALDECEEEDDDGPCHWVLPTPARSGDYLERSRHAAPRRSILRKTSSYADGLDLSVSQGSRASPSRAFGCKRCSFLGLGASGSGAASTDLDDPRASIGAEPSPSGAVEARDGDVADAVADADQAAGGGAAGGRRSADPSPKVRRNVSFDSVDVREYDRIVGDHPACRSGPPLSLDWSYSKKHAQDLEDYELARSLERRPYRKLRVNKWARRNLLALHWGQSEELMKEARRETKKMQRRRSATRLLQPVHAAEEALLGARGFWRRRWGSGGTHEGDDWSDLSDSLSRQRN